MKNPGLESLKKKLRTQYDEFIDFCIEEIKSNKDSEIFFSKIEHLSFAKGDLAQELNLTIENDGETASFHFKR